MRALGNALYAVHVCLASCHRLGAKWAVQKSRFVSGLVKWQLRSSTVAAAYSGGNLVLRARTYRSNACIHALY